MTDMHTHTHFSDGDIDQSPDTLCVQAKEAGIQYLSITDHDYMICHKELKALSEKHGIPLIPGCEFSCIWNYEGKKVIIHLGGHWLDEKNEAIRQILEYNQSLNYEGYVKEQLHRFNKLLSLEKRFDVDNAYEKIEQMHPQAIHRGKRDSVRFLVSSGIVDSAEIAYKLLAFSGEAHVSPAEFLPFVPMEDGVEAITKSSLCTLNHLYYYHLNATENQILIKHFKELGGQALETVYSRYDSFQRAALFEMCNRYDLLPNCGSDRHDISRDFLQGPEVLFQQLKRRQLQQYGSLYL